jgi:hypothetical protein
VTPLCRRCIEELRRRDRIDRVVLDDAQQALAGRLEGLSYIAVREAMDGISDRQLYTAALLPPGRIGAFYERWTLTPARYTWCATPASQATTFGSSTATWPTVAASTALWRLWRQASRGSGPTRHRAQL